MIYNFIGYIEIESKNEDDAWEKFLELKNVEKLEQFFDLKTVEIEEN